MGKRPVTGAAAPVSRSLHKRGLREKLIVAFSLMSVIPLLVLFYLVSVYVIPHARQTWDVLVVVGLASGIAVLGLVLTRGFVLPVIRLASQAQAIADGQLEKEVDVASQDEVGSIGNALNLITQKVRDNMDQLSVYGEQTKKLNLEINRRMLALSNLLHVSNLIAQSAKLDEVTAFVLEKLTEIEEAELNCLLELDPEDGSFVIRGCVCADAGQMSALRGGRVNSLWLCKILEEGHLLAVDAEHVSAEAGQLLRGQFGMANAVFQPIVSMRQNIAVLVSANRKAGFSFGADCLDLLKVFGKQMAIAVEKDLLAKRADTLKVIDELTGLYNASYIKSRLSEEIRRAERYHRPCSLVLLDIDDFEKLLERHGTLASEAVLHQVAELMKAQVTEVDRIGRMGPDQFALILPERNKREALDLAEAIRKTVERHVFANGPALLPCSVHLCAAVSENPLDGSEGERLFAKAAEAMKAAKQQGKNKVLAA